MKNGIVAVGVVAAVTTDPGTVQLYHAADWGFGAPATPALATLAASASVVATAGFSAYNGQEATLRAAGVRIIPDPAGPAGVTAAQDFEPEYISVSPDGTKAFVTIQEANAVAVLDLATNTNRRDPAARSQGSRARSPKA